MTLQAVGIHQLSRPISIRTKEGTIQQSIATVDLHVHMVHGDKDSCIEQIIPLLGTYTEDLHVGILPTLLREVKQQLQAEEARMSFTFPYFIQKVAPVSGTTSIMEYQCRITGSSEPNPSPRLSVTVPLTTLCPCSKEISEFGAHNQRAQVTLTVQPSGFIWLEDLIRLIEQCGSCEVYALLKRPDEKFVTEKAYNTPMFVEDVARKVTMELRKRKEIDWFSVEVESFESIHKHSAYAYIDSKDLDSSCC
ncbi:GTP cyclohydrolase FolE2 [Desulfogranum japonicum]|uniref:GTP cyclohydrolase FolE2 n=1 Tax=Desulfogranum japonicum TaxID=231447 RepID=UPI000410942D|nr:GTP cyclohydrolase FolE2 [Desulfogranum japonicum]